MTNEEIVYFLNDIKYEARLNYELMYSIRDSNKELYDSIQMENVNKELDILLETYVEADAFLRAFLEKNRSME